MVRHSVTLLCVFAALLSSCASAPKQERPQYTRHNYTFSILFEPEKPVNSPQLDLALSLLYMEYPAERAQFFNDFLYSNAGPDTYKDRVIQEQREMYRDRLSPAVRPESKWYYTEIINIKESLPQGMIVERVNEIYTGGAHPFKIERYYVLDMEENKQLKISDFFPHYQTDGQLRKIIYDNLRNYSKLEKRQPLSDGIFFANAPELTFNFYITKEGLALHWDPYQIAPYSEGSIEIILPWYTVRHLMLASGIQLLTKFDIFLFA